MQFPRRVLMVEPHGFRIEYAINPHMRDASGKLNQIDSTKARVQWENFKKTFQGLGLEVLTLPGATDFPDMTFCANQTFPIKDSKGNAALIMGNMKNEPRKGEVNYFADWAENQGFRIFAAPQFSFEGCGDAIWNYETGEIYGGHGFRTDALAYEEIERRFPLKFIRVPLVNEEFYHLDTCFAVLRSDVAAYVEEAFSKDIVEMFRSKFKTLIQIPYEEAKKNFAGNMCGVGGHSVVMQAGSTQTMKQLSTNRFEVIEVDTSEFIKAGGSVFCLKQFLF